MVTASELTNQIFKVEGVNVDIVQFVGKKRRFLNKLRYPEYPYDTKFNGPVERLVEERIIPLIQKETVVDDEDE